MEKIMGLGGKANPLSSAAGGETQIEDFLVGWNYTNVEMEIIEAWICITVPSPNGEG